MHDPFTARLIDAIRSLVSRGCMVFVARGPHPNPLSAAGLAVASTSVPTRISASEACVVAAERAWLRQYASKECDLHG
jgi:hypothetical protein